MKSVKTAVLTHAHSDHARRGSEIYHAAQIGVGLLHERLGSKITVQGYDYRKSFDLGRARLTFYPAGHILGSAQVKIEADGQVWVYSGDYKRDFDPTCEAFEVVPCDVFITEATFALPVYRWDPLSTVAAEVLEWWEHNRNSGVTSVLNCYSLGKGQRVLAEIHALTRRKVILHPSMKGLSRCYEDAGVSLGDYEILGETAEDLAGALVIAPPSSAGLELHRCETAFASGWMRVGKHRRGRGYARGFVISDHADWPSLVRTARETGARKVLVTHGDGNHLARYLTETGIPSECF